MKQLIFILLLPLFACQTPSNPEHLNPSVPQSSSHNNPSEDSSHLARRTSHNSSPRTSDNNPSEDSSHLAPRTSHENNPPPAPPRRGVSSGDSSTDNPPTQKKYTFPWLDNYNQADMLVNRIGTPFGYQRTQATTGSFAEWLRHLPLKAGNPDVLLYNGAKKGYQGAHHAVINMDVGKSDLQQCADATMRLRAEYLWQAGKKEAISFKFTSGHPARYGDWKAGKRPVINGNKVSWVSKAKATDTYPSFKKYLIKVYQFAGTASLDKELPSKPIEDLQSGDVFIQGGFPGHAVMVMDVAEHPTSGEKMFLLAQSYMPAQEMHILRNPSNESLSPWYSLEEVKRTGLMQTPEWGFESGDLHRFK